MTQPRVRWWGRVVNRIDAFSNVPRLDYYVLGILTALLTIIGLVMVLSSSQATSVRASQSPWADFFQQAVYVMVGLVGLYLTTRMRPRTIKKLAPWGIVISLILLCAVFVPGLGTGLEQMGSQSWLVLGPISMQPSEVGKLAMAVWGSAVLADRASRSRRVKDVFGLFLAVSLIVIILIVAERDLGMVASIMIVLLALAWFVGLPQWVAGSIVIGGLALATVLTLTAGYRSNRVTVWKETLFGKFTNTQGNAYQSYQGFLSLGDGSFSGQGIGQSRAKWFYLPEAKNDFIFAIVGEELGFLGAGFVITLFALLGWVGMKIALKQVDPFLKLLAGTVTTGIVIQAFINIGYVVGLLPVTGIQLPLISSGGTSVIVTLTSIGLVLNCARHEPETVSHMQSYGRPLIDKILHIPEPEVYRPAPRTHSDRHHRVQRFGEPVTTRQRERPARPTRQRPERITREPLPPRRTPPASRSNVSPAPRRRERLSFERDDRN